MKKIKIGLTVVLLSINYLLLGQGNNSDNELKEAAKIADKFFQALTLLDLPEGKEMLDGLTFETSEYPIISSNNILYESLFDTDVSEVKGYKRLAMIKATSKAGTTLELRYILISYKDFADNRWKIFEFRKALDTSAEVSAAKGDIENPRENDSRKLQYKYRNLAYWEIMDGKIKSALDNINKASEEARKASDAEFVVKNLVVLNKIIK